MHLVPLLSLYTTANNNNNNNDNAFLVRRIPLSSTSVRLKALYTLLKMKRPRCKCATSSQRQRAAARRIFGAKRFSGA